MFCLIIAITKEIRRPVIKGYKCLITIRIGSVYKSFPTIEQLKQKSDSIYGLPNGELALQVRIFKKWPYPANAGLLVGNRCLTESLQEK